MASPGKNSNAMRRIRPHTWLEAVYGLKHRELQVHQRKWKAASLGYRVTPIKAAA